MVLLLYMNKLFNVFNVFGSILLMCLIVVGVSSFFTSENKVEKTQKDLKYLTCVEEMQKAIPDANDTEARSAFLKDCEN